MRAIVSDTRGLCAVCRCRVEAENGGIEMGRMSDLHAISTEANGGHDPNLPDDQDWDSPPATAGLVVRQRVRAGSVPGWVEVIEADRIGVRLVNGNFKWYGSESVRPDPHGFGDSLGPERP